VAAVGHHDEAGFLAVHELLDHHPRAALVVLHAQGVVGEHGVDGGVGFVQAHRHHHALAGGQAVGLDDDRRALGVHVGVGGGGVGEGLVLGRRDLVALQELLGEVLGAFELGGEPGRPEDRQAGGAEGVHDAGGQRRLGADHGEGDLLGPDEVDQRRDGGDGHVLDAGLAGGAGVARRDETLGTRGERDSFQASACSRRRSR
jgi:hypothetical protein